MMPPLKENGIYIFDKTLIFLDFTIITAYPISMTACRLRPDNGAREKKTN
jgi:hypothetical protein